MCNHTLHYIKMSDPEICHFLIVLHESNVLLLILDTHRVGRQGTLLCKEINIGYL